MDNNKINQTIMAMCKIALNQQKSIQNISEMYQNDGSMELMVVESSSGELVNEIGQLIKSMELSSDTLDNEYVKEVVRQFECCILK